MVLRLLWLLWRQAPVSVRAGVAPDTPFPPLRMWLWAALSAGLPLALPFVARSMASRSGEGALAIFNYAWKLIELPLLLVIQWSRHCFPGIAAAFSAASKAGHRRRRYAGADCVCPALRWLRFAAGLLAGAPALARLLFGWPHGPAGVEQVASWERTGPGACCRKPDRSRAHCAGVAAPDEACRRCYALALAAFFALGAAGVQDAAR